MSADHLHMSREVEDFIFFSLYNEQEAKKVWMSDAHQPQNSVDSLEYPPVVV